MVVVAPGMSSVSLLESLPTAGVTAPHSLSDEACQHRIQHLLQGARPEFRSLRITSHRGTVTLAGQVRSFYLRQLAIRCCQQVGGVFRINDQLQVAAA